MSTAEEIKAPKKSVTIDLHGAAVDLPAVKLVTPGPLPTLPKTKVKKAAGGLCASCFGAKSAEKKKKEQAAESVPVAPIEPQKPVEKEDEEKKDLSPILEVSPSPSTTVNEPILPRVNIDQFRERNFQKKCPGKMTFDFKMSGEKTACSF